MVHFLGCLMLHPMGSIGKEYQLSIVAVIDAGTGHPVAECHILHAPQYQRGDFYLHVPGGTRLIPDSPVPVDHGSHRTRLGPGFLVLLDILIGERMDLPTAAQGTDRPAPVV